MYAHNDITGMLASTVGGASAAAGSKQQLDRKRKAGDAGGTSSKVKKAAEWYNILTG